MIKNSTKISNASETKISVSDRPDIRPFPNTGYPARPDIGFGTGYPAWPNIEFGARYTAKMREEIFEKS